jgi:long-subunit fatty acid transport protein
MKKHIFFVLMVCFLFVSPSFAADLGRSFGLGGAFIGVADDPSAIFYNPAGLSQIKRPQIGASGGSDFYVSSTKYDLAGLLPLFKTDGAVNAASPGFFGATYPFLSAANPLVGGLALGSSYVLDILETGDLPTLPPPNTGKYNKSETSVLIKTESKAFGMGYQVMQNFSLGLSLILDDSVKNLGLTAIDESGDNPLLPALVFNSSAYNRTSVLLGGLCKFGESASIGATINVPGDAVRNTTVFFPLGSLKYLQFSYLEKLPPVFGIGGSYRPMPALLLALDVRNTPALTYKSKVKTDLFGDGGKDKIKSDAYTEFHAGCEYTFDLGGGAGMPLRIGYASVPVHSSTNAWDVYIIDHVIGLGGTKSSTKRDESLVALSIGYEKDNLSVDLGVQSLSEDLTAIKAETGTTWVGVKNRSIVLRGLLSCGVSF